MADSDDRPAVAVGLTGARFGGPSRRRRIRPAPAWPPPAVPADAPEVGLTGARFGGATRRRREGGPPAVPPPAPVAAVPALPVLHDPGPAASRSTIVRPYVLTGGRTRGRVQFAVEALVTTRPVPGRLGEPVEHGRIRELCRAPRSVAEVAALLGAPLGVARVLLADLLAAGAVTVHRTADAGGPDVALMERVLAGLRRL